MNNLLFANLARALHTYRKLAARWQQAGSRQPTAHKLYRVRRLQRLHRQIQALRYRLGLAGSLALGAALPAQAQLSRALFVDGSVKNPFSSPTVRISSGQASPALADTDGDGDLDLFVGQNDGSIAYYQNVGTAARPRFALPATGAANPFGALTTAVRTYSNPTFGDVDGDGDLDAFVGVNGNVRFYRNTGSRTAPTFTEQKGAANPLMLAAGVVDQLVTPRLIDLDGDGDLDLTVATASGTSIAGTVSMLYYRNMGSATAPAFTAQTGGANPFANLSLPLTGHAFGDVDGDGDLDMFVGSKAGTFLYFLNTGSRTSPAFSSVTGAGNPLDGFNVSPAGGVQGQSEPFLADLDNDGDLDLISGSGDGILRYYQNTGTRTAPKYAVPTGLLDNPVGGGVDVGGYSVPTFTDIDGDGDPDAFVGAADGQLYFFANVGTRTNPVFEPRTGAGNPLNAAGTAAATSGGSSAVTFADLDGDGDPDAFVSNNEGVISYYRNTGSRTAPAFTLTPAADNPFNGLTAGTKGRAIILLPTPVAFGDVDGDGDLDAFVVGFDAGANKFRARYFKNTGTATAPALVAQAGPLDGLNLPSQLLTLADADRDGDLDAFGGDQLNLTAFENTGTSTAPSFVARTGAGANPLNMVLTNGIATFVAPSFTDIDGDGDQDLFIGSSDGTLRFFENQTTLTPLSVNLISFSAERSGLQVKLQWTTAAERNSRGFELERSANGRQFDRLLFQPGQGTSGVYHTYTATDPQPLSSISYYRLKQVDYDGTFSYFPIVVVAADATLAHVYPNPVTDQLTVGGAAAGTPVYVRDSLGRLVLTTTLGPNGTLGMHKLPTGDYLLTVPSGVSSASHTYRVIKAGQ